MEDDALFGMETTQDLRLLIAAARSRLFSSPSVPFRARLARSPRIRPGLPAAAASFGSVLLVTGRILDERRRVAGDLHFVDGVVAENGAVIHFPTPGTHRRRAASMAERVMTMGRASAPLVAQYAGNLCCGSGPGARDGALVNREGLRGTGDFPGSPRCRTASQSSDSAAFSAIRVPLSSERWLHNPCQDCARAVSGGTGSQRVGVAAAPGEAQVSAARRKSCLFDRLPTQSSPSSPI